MKRQNGYYWVHIKLDGVDEWRIGYCYKSEVSERILWSLPGLRTMFHDEDFEEIDERKIEREPIIDAIHCDTVVPVTQKEESEVVKEIAGIAWKGAANAFRMYPENKHTFAGYWDAAKQQFEKFSLYLDSPPSITSDHTESCSAL